MELVAVLLTIFLTATLLAWITKVNLAYLFAPSIFLVTFWEYLFGLIGFLNLGMEIFVLLVSLITLILFVRGSIFRKTILKNLFLPSTVTFFLLSIVSFVKTKDWLLYQWDEFTHWGHVIKIMYEYAALGPGTPTDYASENYPPALALFQYFVMDFSPAWREGLLFWASHLIAISIIVSALAKCSFNNISEIALKVFVALVASFAFLNYLDTITSDSILAIVFGFLIFVAIRNPKLDSKWGFVFATTAGFLTLVKPIGIYFACAAILLNIVATLFSAKFKSGWKFILSFSSALTTLLIVGIAWISWGAYLASLTTSNYSLINEIPPTFSTSGRELEVNRATSAFINALLHTGLNPISWANMSASQWTIVCVIFFSVWVYVNGKEKIVGSLGIGITLLALTAGYFAVIFYSYLTLFAPGQAEAIPAFPRYVATWYQGVFFAMALLILSEFDLTQNKESHSVHSGEYRFPSKKHMSVLLVTFMALSSISSIGYYVSLLRAPQYKGADWRSQFTQMVNAINLANMPTNSKVYIIAQNTIGYEYYVLRYEMIGMQFGEMPFSIGTKNYEGDIWTEPTMDAKKWSRTLRDFDFVVLYMTTDGFIKEFSSLFENENIEPNSVYKVMKYRDKVLLAKVD